MTKCTGGPGDLKNCDVTKVKLIFFLNFQIYFLDFRLLIFQPKNVGKINLDKKLKSSNFKQKHLHFLQLLNYMV